MSVATFDPNYPAAAAAVASGGTLTVRTSVEEVGAARALAETAGLTLSGAVLDAGAVVLTFGRA